MAQRYGCDPGAVLEWPEWRIQLALDCLRAGLEHTAERARQIVANKGTVTATVEL